MQKLHEFIYKRDVWRTAPMATNRDEPKKLQCTHMVQCCAVVKRRNGNRKMDVLWYKVTIKYNAMEKQHPAA